MSKEEKKINVEYGDDSEQTKAQQTETEKEEKKADNKEADKKEDKKADKADNDKKEETDKKSEKKDPLTEAKEENAKLKDAYIRQVAEFDNYRKRTLKEKADLILNGTEKSVSAVLPILDDFERALNDKNEDTKAIKEGFELIYKKFQKVLATLGVKEIDTKDKDFNTDEMEAIAMVPGMGDDKKGKVIDCVQKGYTINDKVIRHAKVAVGQ